MDNNNDDSKSAGLPLSDIRPQTAVAAPTAPEAPEPSAQPSSPTPPTEPARSNSKKILGLLIGLLVVLIGLGAYFWLTNKPATKATTAVSSKVYHVGVLSGLDFFGKTTDGFKQKMTELGYVEGKNITYDVQKTAAPVGNQAVIKKFVDAKVDLILAFPTEASLEAKAGTKGTSIPVISTNAIVEATGLIESVAHPGGNVTGVRFPGPEIAVRRLELLHQIAPNAKRIWVPYLKDYPSVAPELAALEPDAKALGLTVTRAPFAGPAELAAYLAARPATGDQGFDAMVFVPEPLTTIPDAITATNVYADAHKLPIAGSTILQTDSGSILNVLPNSVEVGKLVAPLADKIFKGASAGSLPIVTPETELSINYKAIQKLHLTVDDALLSTAKTIVR